MSFENAFLTAGCILLVAFVWSIVGLLQWRRTERELRLKGLKADRLRELKDPVRQAPSPSSPPRDIGSGQLAKLIFRSHVIFPRPDYVVFPRPDSPAAALTAGWSYSQCRSVPKWVGTGRDLGAALSGRGSSLTIDEIEKLPPPAALARRLYAMSFVTGHYLQVTIEQDCEDLEQIRFCLTLNPEAARR